MAVMPEAIRRNTVLTEWFAFFAQILLAISFEVGDDLGRGLVAQHGTVQGIENAREIVAFETTHGFFVEPAWQLFFLQTHHILSFTSSITDMIRLVNGIYILGHVCVTLGVAIWVYFYRRPLFAVLRNTVMLVNLFALFVYESFPVAPPRLTTGILFDHHPFTFQDTVFGAVSAGGKLLGSSAGYNEFSAMPSVHMAWALCAGVALLLLARQPLIRLCGLLYPCCMLVAVVVTGNHYLLDCAGGLAVTILASCVAVSFEYLRGRPVWPLLTGESVPW